MASFADAAGSLTVTYASNDAFCPSRSSSYVSYGPRVGSTRESRSIQSSSLWRYSSVPNAEAREVRNLASDLFFVAAAASSRRAAAGFSHSAYAFE